MRKKAKRLRALRSVKRSRITVTRVSLHAGAMYGCDVDPLTLQQVRQLRTGVAIGLNCEWGPTNKVAAMLLTAQGLLGPTALAHYRIPLNWRRQVLIGIGPTAHIQRYWRQAVEDEGKTKGPVHLVTQTLRAPEAPTTWKLPNGDFIKVLDIQDFP